MLIKHGCNNAYIHLAKDAKTALEFLSTRHFDFILIDYNLGESLDGLQLLERANRENLIAKHTVIYVVTAEQSRAIFYAFNDLNTDGYIIKPVRINEVADRLIKSYKP